MKGLPLSLVAALAGSAFTSNVRAQLDPREIAWRARTVALTNAPNRFGLSYRSGWNIAASFHNQPGYYAGPHVGSATGGGTDRFYDDGFVRVDSTGNAGGLTSYWGYDNASQVPGNNTVVMNRIAPESGLGSRATSDPYHGFELTWNHRVGQLHHAEWGLEAAFNFTPIDIRDTRPVTGNALRTSDAYSLGGIVPPLPPYSGPLTPPGPLLADAPLSRTQTVQPGAVSITGRRELEAELYGFRLGPYFELPLSRHFAAAVSGGLAVGVVDARIRYDETLTVGSLGPIRRSGSAAHTTALVGGFASVNLRWNLTETTHLFTGLQYQNVGQFTGRAGDKKAVLELGQSLFWTVGLGFRF